MNSARGVRIIVGVAACATIAGCGSKSSDGPTTTAAAVVATTPAVTGTVTTAKHAPKKVRPFQPSAKAKPAQLPANAVAKVGNRLITRAMFNQSVSASPGISGMPAAAAVPDPPNYTKCIAAFEKQQPRQATTTSAAKKASGATASASYRKSLRAQCAQRRAVQVSSAMAQLIAKAQAEQDAKAAGITVSDAEISAFEAEQRKGLPKGQATVKRPGARASARAQLLHLKLVRHWVHADSPGLEARIKAYYDQHQAQHARPALRSVQMETAKSKTAAEVLKRKIAKSKPVASNTMSDAGKLDPLRKLAFSTAEGAIGGPIQVDKLWFIIRVVSITPARTATFDQSYDQIRLQLADGKLSKAAQRRVAKWRARTICRAGYVVPSCGNA